MKPVKYIGVALVAAAALGTVACNNGSTSAPDFNGANSSTVEKTNLQSSSEQKTVASSSSVTTVANSSAVTALSSGAVETCVHFSDLACEPCPPGVKCTCNPCDIDKAKFGSDCLTGAKIVCKDGEWNYYDEKSSSSVTALSSAAMGTCLNVSGKLCAPCMEGYKCPCNPCEQENAEAIDCSTGEKLVCKDGEWGFNYEMSSSSVAPSSSSIQQKCRDFVNMCPPCDSVVGCIMTNNPCNQCLPNVDSIASDCETGLTYICKDRLWVPVEDPSETCKHITDFQGSYSCANQNGSSAVDCITGSNFQCQSNRWQNVACLNIKPDECKPGMGGCDYRLCQRNGIKEIADCENSVVYVCNGETWNVKETEENQRCARGELEYCGACYREGEFEGRYKCEGGKWRKYGMGDEICEHITDVKCEFGTVGCGACDAPENKEVRDCVTGRDFVCQNNFWTAIVVDCDGSASCGIDEYKSCRSNSIVGTACENGATKVIDDCAYACSNGAYIFVPPPM